MTIKTNTIRLHIFKKQFFFNITRKRNRGLTVWYRNTNSKRINNGKIRGQINFIQDRDTKIIRLKMFRKIRTHEIRVIMNSANNRGKLIKTKILSYIFRNINSTFNGITNKRTIIRTIILNVATINTTRKHKTMIRPNRTAQLSKISIINRFIKEEKTVQMLTFGMFTIFHSYEIFIHILTICTIHTYF